MKKVTNEVAAQDFERWLSFKHISDRKREENSQYGAQITEAIQDGVIEVTEDHELKYTLPEPIKDDDGGVICKELFFKPRIRVEKLNDKLKAYKPTDADGRVLAHISALTGESAGIIGKMYSDDYKLCEAIVMYFL